MKKYLIIFFLIIFNQTTIKADIPHFVDFKFILNQSDAGKKAQDFLKKKLDDGLNNLKKKEKKLMEEEKKIIQQKKIISAEEYKKKVTELRAGVSSLQKERYHFLHFYHKLFFLQQLELNYVFRE